MPIVKNQETDHGCWALWEITEPLSFFVNAYPLVGQELTTFKQVTHPEKQLEWIASRMLAKMLYTRYGLSYKGLFSDDFGRPHFVDSHIHISLSHSFPYVAVIVSTQSETGIDIEKQREQLKLLSRRFLSEEELSLSKSNIRNLCILWCAKEALYKVYGKKQLAFKENIIVNAKEIDNEGILFGLIKKDHFKVSYSLAYCFYKDLGICFIK